MSGRYDSQCPGCKGEGKVKEIKEDVIKADSQLGKSLKAYYDNLRFDAEYAAEVAAERRMGA